MARHTKPDPTELDNWKRFTLRIFADADADPGYYAIQYADLPHDQKLRVAVAWCAYYNLGIAAKASEYVGKKFWNYLESVYPTAKRASERRHFRGAAGLKALASWRETFKSPEQMAEFMHRPDGTYFDVRSRTNTVAQMGPYFAWKWCDLNEVLFDNPIDFTGAEKYSPKVPQEGAKLLFPDAHISQAYGMITEYAERVGVVTFTAKNIDRPFGIQEAETVCCVYKQMANGSYIYGSRTAKAVARMDSVQSDTAGKMTEALLGLSPWKRADLKKILEAL